MTVISQPRAIITLLCYIDAQFSKMMLSYDVGLKGAQTFTESRILCKVKALFVYPPAFKF